MNRFPFSLRRLRWIQFYVLLDEKTITTQYILKKQTKKQTHWEETHSGGDLANECSVNADNDCKLISFKRYCSFVWHFFFLKPQCPFRLSWNHCNWTSCSWSPLPSPHPVFALKLQQKQLNIPSNKNGISWQKSHPNTGTPLKSQGLLFPHF